MSVSAPFTPTGNTVVFTANAAAPSAVQVSSNVGSVQYEVVNNGNVTVFMGYGNTATVAQNGAVIPNTGNSQPCLVVLPGSDKIYSLNANLFFTGITVSGAANVFVVPGDGD